MAQKLKSFDWSKQSVLTTSAKADYPWEAENGSEEAWFDGDMWQIEEDEDFETSALMMERIIRTRATGRKAKVQLRHPPSNNGKQRFTVTVQADTPEEGEAALAKQLRNTNMTFKHSPFGTIVLQRTDIEGPTAAKAKSRREKTAATRAANKAVAKAPAKKVAAKRPTKPTKAAAKVPSKRTATARKLQAVS